MPQAKARPPLQQEGTRSELSPIPRTSTPINQALRTCDLPPINFWIICIAEPIESPKAPASPLLRQVVTPFSVRIASILFPKIDTAELLGAGIVDSDTTTGDGEVEMVCVEVGACVDGLDDHFPSGNGVGGKLQSLSHHHT